jgi:uncharacterized protein (TIGR02466 family)
MKKNEKIIEGRITPIFPTPVYTSNLKRKFFKKEINYIMSCKKNSILNEGNITSKNNYVLQNKIFDDINLFLDVNIKNYFKEIFNPLYKIEPYITQSWLNFTKKNQYHHSHNHPNSIISGVLYIKTNKDSICFLKHNRPEIVIETKNFNTFNAYECFFEVSEGDLIIFPSKLIHKVENKNSEGERISLAFNVFVKGVLGSNARLTELIL